MAFKIPEEYKRLAGTAYIGDRDYGTGGLDNSQGMLFLGDASELTLDAVQEFTDHNEHQSGAGFKDLKVPHQTIIKGSLTLDAAGILNLREFVRCSLTETEGLTVVGEPHSVPDYGLVFSLNEPVALAVSEIRPAAGGTAFVPDVDYRSHGRLIYVPLDSVMQGVDVEVDYVSVTSDTLELFALTFAEKYLYFQGRNTVDEFWVTLELWRVAFEPATLSNILGDEIVTLSVAFDALWEPLKYRNTDWEPTDTAIEPMGGFGQIINQRIQISDGGGVYCSRILSDLFARVLAGTGIYCNRPIDEFFTSPLNGTGIYCAQDMSLLTI